MSKGKWIRKLAAERKLGPIKKVYARFFPDTKKWSISIPDRNEQGFYLKTWKDIPDEDLLALAECIADVQAQRKS